MTRPPQVGARYHSGGGFEPKISRFVFVGYCRVLDPGPACAAQGLWDLARRL